jgi:hypothetical protein
MCPSPIGIAVVDVPIVFQLRMAGDVTQSVTLVPHCPVEQRDFCNRICTG